MSDTNPSALPPRSSTAAEPTSPYGHRSSRSRSAAPGVSPFIPILILLAGMVAWSGFQLHHLTLESTALDAARAGQEAQLQQAQKIRQALEAVANETRKLADAGNPNARSVVEELRKRGVTINPAAAGVTPSR